MSKFALHLIKTIKGKQEFFQLSIHGVNTLDRFEHELSKSSSHLSEFRTMLTYMEYVANNKTLPDSKFKDITPKNEKFREYEFKSKHLRIYGIQKKNGKIIVLCGYKNSQKENIKNFRLLKKALLEEFKIEK
jgi:hypothetical protein